MPNVAENAPLDKRWRRGSGNGHNVISDSVIIMRDFYCNFDPVGSYCAIFSRYFNYLLLFMACIKIKISLIIYFILLNY